MSDALRTFEIMSAREPVQTIIIAKIKRQKKSNVFFITVSKLHKGI
jgi:hypothetical protein